MGCAHCYYDGEEHTGPQVVAEAEAGGEDTPLGGRMLVWGHMLWTGEAGEEEPGLPDREGELGTKTS